MKRNGTLLNQVNAAGEGTTIYISVEKLYAPYHLNTSVYCRSSFCRSVIVIKIIQV